MNVRQVIPRDAIPSIDDPAFGEGYGGSDEDEVLVVDADPPRAYPLRILDYHEIVNDRLAGEPIAVTWCPLCGSAIVYDRRIDGRTLSFGVSGKLADDDLVMYDRETDSEWKQSSGECITGELEGGRLEVRPASVVPWKTFRDRHADGSVLQPIEGAESEAAGDGETPERIDYDERPYADYFSSAGFGLGAHTGEGGRAWNREDLDPKTIVLGLEADGDAIGIPLPTVREAGGVLETTVGGRDVVVFATEGGIHAFEEPGYDYRMDEDGTITADGTTWDGATGRGADGRRLDRVSARRLFAFAWRDDHGEDAFLPSE